MDAVILKLSLMEENTMPNDDMNTDAAMPAEEPATEAPMEGGDMPAEGGAEAPAEGGDMGGDAAPAEGGDEAAAM